MNQFYKNLALWLVIGLMMVILVNIFKAPSRQASVISYSTFLSMVENDDVLHVTIQGNNILIDSKAGKKMTFAPEDPDRADPGGSVAAVAVCL